MIIILLTVSIICFSIMLGFDIYDYFTLRDTPLKLPVIDVEEIFIETIELKAL